MRRSAGIVTSKTKGLGLPSCSEGFKQETEQKVRQAEKSAFHDGRTAQRVGRLESLPHCGELISYCQGPLRISDTQNSLPGRGGMAGEMTHRLVCHTAPGGRAREEPDLEQVRLHRLH